MTAETESLRQKFERQIVATGRSEGELIFEAGHYLYPDVQEMWELYQAGYAAAKAETAAPVVGRWYFVTNDGAATLCVDEADAREAAAEADIAFPRMAPHLVTQLVSASQLAAAVADEREKCALVCDRRVMGDNNREDSEARRCADAIRAGAKETSDG